MADDVRTVTVRLPEPLHRAVKVRCAERGDSLEGVARAAFVAYLERGDDEPGSVLERAGVRPAGLEGREVGDGDTRENRAGGMASRGGATGSVTEKQDLGASRPSSPERPFRPDPKGGSKT